MSKSKIPKQSNTDLSKLGQLSLGIDAAFADLTRVEEIKAVLHSLQTATFPKLLQPKNEQEECVLRYEFDNLDLPTFKQLETDLQQRHEYKSYSRKFSFCFLLLSSEGFSIYVYFQSTPQEIKL